MIQAFLAFSGLLVARAWIVEIDVVVADAGFATAARSARIAKVVVSAFVTTSARVAGSAIAPAHREKKHVLKKKTDAKPSAVVMRK